MVKYEIKNETPTNIEQLKHMANNQNSWQDRLKAVQELRYYNCQQSRDIITRLALHDIVFQVKEEAFRAAQAFGITKNGKPLFLGKKPQGNLIKEISKKLVHVRDSLSEDYSLEEFKEAFQRLYPAAYDAYEGDKGVSFDKWLENTIQSLPKKK